MPTGTGIRVPSENGAGGNTDGFGFHPNAKGYTGNIIRGCRAWFNSDDGYDCINASEATRFENCWAFFNGYTSAFVSKGDGNGFKVGGYGAAPVVSGLPNPIPSNTVQFCMAYRNKANGFYSNHHVTTGNSFYNNTAYRNSTNFNMLSQKITKSPYSGADTSVDCPGYNHVLHNNLSFRTNRDTLNMGSCNFSFNSFTPNSGVTVDATDFLSTDEALLIAPRGLDGSLPITDFLRLKSTSDLINKGMNLGFAFSGSAPDFGAFEYKDPNALNPIKTNKIGGELTVVSDPSNSTIQTLHFNLSEPAKVGVRLFDSMGRMLYQKKPVQYGYGENNLELEVSLLSKGIYLVCIEFEKGIRSVRMAI